MMNLVGTGCADCIDGACNMNCSSAVLAMGSEWIAASIWAGAFPAKATAEQVVEWRAAQAIEARRAETSGSARESAVGEADAPNEPQGCAHTPTNEPPSKDKP